MIMIAAYNLYLGGFLPEVSPKNSIHNKRELKNKYKSIVSLNNANPLVMVELSADTQAYALNVKEMSMELSEALQDVLNGRSEDVEDNMNRVLSLYNGLLKRSDEYGEANHKPSRPGGELRYLVEGHTAELFESGIAIDSDGFLSFSDEAEIKVPEKFIADLASKAEQMSMNPMEYVDKKVYSYAHLYRSDIGTAYQASAFSGMLFNSYC